MPRLDPDAVAGVSTIPLADGSSQTVRIEGAGRFNATVDRALWTGLDRGWAATAQPIALSQDLVAVRIQGRKPNGRTVSDRTLWYSLARGRQVNPREFLTDELLAQVRFHSALATSGRDGKAGRLLRDDGRLGTRSLGFTAKGDLAWAVLRDGKTFGLRMSAADGLTALGRKALRATRKPSDPSQPVPATDCSVDRCIALTFDDGPTRHTPALLDVLARQGAKATFFVTGAQIAGDEAVLARIVADGHQLGNHGQTHRSLVGMTDAQVREEVLSVERRIQPYLGEQSRVFRPPYGEYDGQVRAVLAALGYSIMMWSVDPRDYAADDAEDLADLILEQADRDDIVLAHDTSEVTVEAMERVVVELTADGFRLVTLDELLGGSLPGEVHSRG